MKAVRRSLKSRQRALGWKSIGLLLREWDLYETNPCAAGEARDRSYCPTLSLS